MTSSVFSSHAMSSSPTTKPWGSLSRLSISLMLLATCARRSNSGRLPRCHDGQLNKISQSMAREAILCLERGFNAKVWRHQIATFLYDETLGRRSSDETRSIVSARLFRHVVCCKLSRATIRARRRKETGQESLL